MWWSPKMAFPLIYGLPKYIHIRKWSLFLPFESGLTPWLLWPFRRLEYPCLELETSASSLLECSFLGFSLLGTQLPYGEMSKWHKEANEGELGTLVNSSFCAPSWQCQVPATWVRLFGCSSPFEPSRCPLSQSISHGAEESPNHA